MLFSIIVPIYNVEEYLERCVDSLINQTFKDIEIILVDDESPDNCPTMCDEYAQKESRIKVIHKKNGGLSDARNAGLEIAQGEYVMFVDSDDYITLEACEKFSKYALKNYDVLVGDAEVTGGSHEVSYDKTLQNKVLNGIEFLKQSLQMNKMPMAACLSIYRKDFLSENNLRFKFGILHEDEQFTPRAYLKATSVCYTGIKFYHYIIRDGSITVRKDKRKNARDLYETCCELEQVYGQLPDKKLKKLLLDSLVVKYLNIYQVGNLGQYGKEFIQKRFAWKNAKRLKTRLKAWLFIVSPRLYFKINEMTKKLS